LDLGFSLGGLHFESQKQRGGRLGLGEDYTP
jgi:hypothetical protein